MTKPLEALIADANQSATIMEYLASFEPQDIEGDDVELRFELDGIDTGTDVSLVEQCGKASEIIKALIAALEQKDKYITELREWSVGLAQESCEQQHRIAELESQRQMAFIASNRWADKFRNAEKRIAELEASQLAVKLPPSFDYEHDDLVAVIPVMEASKVRKALCDAGITVQGDE